VSEIVRLTLVSHAMTDAMSAGRFPLDEPLSDLGVRQAQAAVPVSGALVCAPEQRARQTAELIGATALADVRLADLDVGRWRGLPLDGLDPTSLGAWLTDPTATPHGGESIVELVARVSDWLGQCSGSGGRVVAVTHPAVVRAAILTALDASPKSFWRIDIAPMSRAVVHGRGRVWTMRL